MEVEFRRIAKVDNEDKEFTDHKTPTEILQMHPMPAGYYAVAIGKFDRGYTAIDEIEPVVFVAICRFENNPEPVTCYAVQKTIWWKLKWFHEDNISIHAYGPYVEACKLVDQQPLSFVVWARSIGEGEIFFDIPLYNTANSAPPKTTPQQES